MKNYSWIIRGEEEEIRTRQINKERRLAVTWSAIWNVNQIKKKYWRVNYKKGTGFVTSRRGLGPVHCPGSYRLRHLSAPMTNQRLSKYTQVQIYPSMYKTALSVFIQSAIFSTARNIHKQCIVTHIVQIQRIFLSS